MDFEEIKPIYELGYYSDDNKEQKRFMPNKLGEKKDPPFISNTIQQMLSKGYQSDFDTLFEQYKTQFRLALETPPEKIKQHQIVNYARKLANTWLRELLKSF